MWRKIINRLKNLVAKAILSAVNDSGEIQLVKIQGYENEIADGVERVQNYGLTSVPPKGAEAIVVNVGANSDHPVVIAMDSGEFRKKDLKPGEVAVYDKNKSYILFKEDGTIEIKANEGTVKVDSSLESTGDLKDSTGTLDELRQEFNTFVDTTYGVHVHVSAAPGSPTGPPTAP